MSEFSGTIVDVRTRAEFSGGHVAHSVNIPLQEIISTTNEITLVVKEKDINNAFAILMDLKR